MNIPGEAGTGMLEILNIFQLKIDHIFLGLTLIFSTTPSKAGYSASTDKQSVSHFHGIVNVMYHIKVLVSTLIYRVAKSKLLLLRAPLCKILAIFSKSVFIIVMKWVSKSQ